MKQHIRPQFLIKRFSNKKDKLNVYEVDKRLLLKNKHSKNIFYKVDTYSNELEDNFNKNLENKISRLLDEKIINKTEIVLTREELLFLKKFLAIESIRSMEYKTFNIIMKNFSRNAKNYLDSSLESSIPELKNLKSINELNEDEETIFNKTLDAILVTKDLSELLKHSFVYKEIYCWIKSFYNQFVVFWDAPSTQDFIFSDVGMVSEYEPSKNIINYDLSKFSYFFSLQDEIKNNKEITLLHLLKMMTNIAINNENFNIFNLSHKRCIVLVNPFFRLYNPKSLIENKKIPDIWPTYIISKEALTMIPYTKYVHLIDDRDNTKISKYDDKDLFFYKPVELSIEDTVYVNWLILSRINKSFGFVNFEKIKDSLYNFMYTSFLNDITIPLINDKQLWDWFNYIYSNKLKNLVDKYKNSSDLKPNILPFSVAIHLQKITEEDVKQNKYLLNYLLSDKVDLENDKNLEILGPKNERREILKQYLEKLKDYR